MFLRFIHLFSTLMASQNWNIIADAMEEQSQKKLLKIE